MENDFQQSKCKNCSVILIEPRNEKRTPCPVCGEMGRIHDENVEETIVFRDHMRMVGKHGGKGKPFFDSRVGADFYYKTQEWRHLERIIDRDNNLYMEVITDPKTGEVIRKVEEPLSQHRDHGAAKKK